MGKGEYVLDFRGLGLCQVKQLLNGDIYHGVTLFQEREDHQPIWRKILAGKAAKDDWKTLLDDYTRGVDYPVSFYYKEIMEAFPNGKVLLSVRDPVKWYQSVKTLIQFKATATSFPCSCFFSLIGKLFSC